MRAAAPAKDVNVELVGLGEEQVGLGGDEGEALKEADAERAVGDDLGEGEAGSFNVVAALDDLEIRCDGAQVFVGVAVGEVSEAEGLANLARCEELLELSRRLELGSRERKGEVTGLGRDVESAVWDVEVPDNEDEECHDSVRAAELWRPVSRLSCWVSRDVWLAESSMGS